jgi:hypothetical protein
MTEFIRAICEQLLDAEELSPEALAAQLGKIVEPKRAGMPLEIVPINTSFSTARVMVEPDSGDLSLVVLIPAARLTIADLRAGLGPYEESRRLHPDSPRKLMFSIRDGKPHPFVVDVMAEVSVDEKVVDSAAVQRVVIIRADSPPSDVPYRPEEAVTVCPRLLGERVEFGLRSVRDATLEAVRAEVEASLGIQFVPSHEKVYDGAPAFECKLPTCELRLNSWRTDTSSLPVFNLVGFPPEDLDAPEPENISEALASDLRAMGRDWYVPDRLELLEEGGVLGERELDHDVIVSILAPRWLAWCDAEEREFGIQLLGSVVDMWLSAAKRTADPLSDLKSRRAEFESWRRYVGGPQRIKILSGYAVQEQLTMIEDELFLLGELPISELAASADVTRERLTGLREDVAALGEVIATMHVDSIVRQYDRVRAAIDDIADRISTVRR